MVYRVARRYRNLGLGFDDLVAEGNLGLVEAVYRFNPDKGAKFITYAVWWIRKAILKALDEQTTVVRVSCHQKKKLREMRRAERHLERELARKPERSEISKSVFDTEEGVDRLLRYGYREVSLEDPVTRGDDVSLGDTLAERSGESAEDGMIRRERGALLEQAIEKLSDKEQVVLRRRYGYGRPQPETLTEVGARLNVSRERVRQIETTARARLRRMLDRQIRADLVPRPLAAH